MSGKKILIAGGSGLIGKMLKEHFSSHGYAVNILSRQETKRENYFYWNPAKDVMNDEALSGVSCVVNLGGVSLAEGRWTQKRKQEIINSRMLSTDFLFHKLKTTTHSVETFISASAVGCYGNRGEEWVDESSPAGDDFLATCCRYWEEAAQKVSSLGIRTVIFRIGVVLSKDGGALPLLALPVKLFVGAPLGSGGQFISWIHHVDLCNMFLKAAEDKAMSGIYNAVAPEVESNRNFMKVLATVFHRPFFLPAVPPVFLELILGEKAITVTGGQRVLCKKIQDAGFSFQFPALRNALENIYSS
jgi:uncharacterized protein